MGVSEHLRCLEILTEHLSLQCTLRVSNSRILIKTKKEPNTGKPVSGLLSSGTKKDAELIGRPIKHKNNAEPKNKLGPASRWQGQKDLNPRHAVLETAALPTELYP